MTTMTSPQALIPALSTLLREASGVDADGDRVDASFLSLGLDSLFLTQFSVLVSKRYGVSLSFRQLVSELGSLSSLAAFLAERAGVPAAADASPPSKPLCCPDNAVHHLCSVIQSPIQLAITASICRMHFQNVEQLRMDPVHFPGVCTIGHEFLTT